MKKIKCGHSVLFTRYTGINSWYFRSSHNNNADFSFIAYFVCDHFRWDCLQVHVQHHKFSNFPPETIILNLTKTNRQNKQIFCFIFHAGRDHACQRLFLFKTQNYKIISTPVKQSDNLLQHLGQTIFSGERCLVSSKQITHIGTTHQTEILLMKSNKNFKYCT